MKRRFSSKTIIFNAVMGVIDAVLLSAQIIQPYLDAQQFAAAVFVLSAIHKSGIHYLRLITNEPIAR